MKPEGGLCPLAVDRRIDRPDIEVVHASPESIMSGIHHRTLASLILCMFLTAGGAFAQAIDTTRYVIEVVVEEPIELLGLIEDGYNISAIEGTTATIYATADELQALNTRDVSYRLLEVQGGVDSTQSRSTAGSSVAGYSTYAELSTRLQDVADAYGASQTVNADLCRLISLGQSVNGLEIWALLITANPDVEEDEPEFQYISTMHGDEILGTELSLRFIDLLVASYGTDADITALIDATAIWIVPLMNPDGYESVTRTNANGVDLNRDFPTFPEDWGGTIFSGASLDESGRQPETQHVMAWSAANSFVQSANLHGGALVVNYPYDDDDVGSFNDAPSPDDLLFEDISSRYAVNNPPMFNNPSPSNAVGGIINGSLWYSIDGGLMDWSYRYLTCNDVTLELSVNKLPPPRQLDQFWIENQDAMLAYLAAVHMGIRGVVTNADNGAPVYAKVSVNGNTQPVFTDPDVGDYHRMLLPGTYSLTFSAPGFVPKTIDNVEATEPATRLDVELQNAVAIADINGDGQVDASDIQIVINARFGLQTPYDTDVNDDNTTNCLDIQIVTAALLAG
jgi:carboxypeptidase D